MVGEFCRRQSIRPDLLLTSPYRRTVQTASLVAAALGEATAQEAPFLASGMDPELAFAELLAYQRLESIMLIGHQPDLGMLAAWLLALPAETFPFGKASLMCIEVRQLAPGGGGLGFFLPVRMMKAAAD